MMYTQFGGVSIPQEVAKQVQDHFTKAAKLLGLNYGSFTVKFENQAITSFGVTVTVTSNALKD